jgi:trans-aconitate 2-methyltransferase
MLEKARRAGDSGNPEFALADLRFWSPPVPLDRIVSNAALHWVPDHPRVFEGLARLLAPGGVMAVQMPANREETAYRILLEFVAEPLWSGKVGRETLSPPLQTPAWYAEQLRTLGLDPDVWETIYHHRLRAPVEIVEWMKGSVLRPVLAGLTPGQAGEFLDEFGARLEAAYPTSSAGVIFPFRRLFFVARKA